MALARSALLGVYLICLGALSAGCTLSSSLATNLVTDLALNGPDTDGRSVSPYQIEPGIAAGDTVYVDRDFAIDSPVNGLVRRAVLIRTAERDSARASENSDFLQFTVGQSATVYVGHDTRITTKPAWLLTDFIDTGTQFHASGVEYELYVNVYAAGARVVLGSNLPPGEPQEGRMYVVFVRPASEGPQVAPALARVEVTCATAGVVGLSWSAEHDVTPAGYRLYRDDQRVFTTAATDWTDHDVAPEVSYSYSVEAYAATGRVSTRRQVAVTTPSASVSGDAPVCRSPVIESLQWNWGTGHHERNGSDLWPVTWGGDGAVYAFFGDGGGFGGDDHRGRSSWGIAAVSGTPPPSATMGNNTYGGLGAPHPSTISGKAGSLIAVGADLYAIGGLYGAADTLAEYPHRPSGSPNHSEMIYSLGNAYSWHRTPWTFCSADAGGRGHLTGVFCPSGFVNRGRGNAAATDPYVYLFGVRNEASCWGGDAAQWPRRTYLARVAARRLRERDAYEFFSGLDTRARPIWSPSTRRLAPVFVDANASQPACGAGCDTASTLQEAVYDAALHRYIGVAQGDNIAQTSFYDAPEPWGPWTVIDYNNLAVPRGTGGWANLGARAGHALGVHPIGAWFGSAGLALWVTYSSDGRAPPEALVPPAGEEMDSLNVLNADIRLTETATDRAPRPE